MNNNYRLKFLMAQGFMYFLLNQTRYTDVIKWVTEHNPRCDGKHFMEKIEALLDRYTPAEAWVRFYCDLDDGFKSTFIDYITEVFLPKGFELSQEDKGILHNY